MDSEYPLREDMPEPVHRAAHAPLITVVDDDASVRQSLHRLVRSLGYEVVSYSTVAEYLRSLTLADTTLLILDVQMPGMSGLDLQNVIVALRSPIPIIFITAHPEEEVRIRAMNMGAFGFLEKPFDDQALISLIDKAI